MKLIKHKVSKEAKAWIKKEAAEQKTRYREIVKEMEELSPKRDKWVESFFDRICSRGFNVHFNNRRVIKREELPKKPRRKFRVVF